MAVIGCFPDQTDRLSVWQIFAALNGHAEANSQSGARLSEAEKVDLFDWIDGGDIPASSTPLPALTWDGARLSAE